MKVLDHGIQVEALEFLGVVERLAHRIGQGGVLVENLKVQLVRPPVPVGPDSNSVCMTGHLPALVVMCGFFGHVSFLRYCSLRR